MYIFPLKFLKILAICFANSIIKPAYKKKKAAFNMYESVIQPTNEPIPSTEGKRRRATDG
jgi:hypothetical protein